MTPETLTDLTLKVVVVVLSNNDTGNVDRSDTEGGCSCTVVQDAFTWSHRRLTDVMLTDDDGCVVRTFCECGRFIGSGYCFGRSVTRYYVTLCASKGYR